MLVKLWSLSFLAAGAFALPQQTVFDTALQSIDTLLTGSEQPSHLSRWCNQSKSEFLHALHNGGAQEWTIVMGTEAAGNKQLFSLILYSF